MLINCTPSHCFGHSDREAVRRYEELSDIFSDKDNYSQSRELLKEVSFCQDIMKTKALQAFKKKNRKSGCKR